MKLRTQRGLALVMALVAICVIGASSASAALPTLPDVTWGTNGRVDATLRVGNTIYIGGNFTGLEDPVSGATQPVTYLAGLDATTGAPTSFAPVLNGEVLALAQSPDGSRLYVAGAFTTVGGKAQKRIAVFDTTTGAQIAWKPYASPNNVVRALAVTATRVYIGGGFTKIGTAAVSRIAALDATTGAAVPGFSASADNLVRDLVLTSSRLYLAGNFTNVNGTVQGKLAAVNPNTGASIAGVYHPSYPVLDLAAGDKLYGAGGGGGGKALAVNLATGAKVWEIKTDGNVQAVDVLDGVPYFGGHFLKYASTVVSQLVRANPATGALDTTWLPQVTAGLLGVFAIDAYGTNKLYVGGDFTRVSGQKNLNFAQFTDGAAPTTADVGVTLAGAPTSVVNGQQVTFTATVTNAGPDTALNTTLTDVLPAAFDFVSAPGCTYASGTRTVTCPLGSVTTAGDTQTITVTGNTAGSVANTVSVAATTTDPNSANNSATATTDVTGAGGADLAVTASAPASVNQGASFSYVVTVKNNGPAAEPAAQLVDTLPTNATLVSATPAAGSCSGTAPVTCSLGALASGASVKVTFTMTAPATAQTLSNVATVGGSGIDPVTANNSVTSSTTVVKPGGTDTTPPAMQSMAMLDQNHDGFVDTVRVTFNEALAVCAAPCTTGWTLSNVPGGGSLQSVTTSGTVATLTISNWTDQPDTSVGLFTVALQKTNGIQDAAGNHSSFAATAPADDADPVPVGFRHQHNSGTSCVAFPNTMGVPGDCDELTSEWSEQLAPSSIPATTVFTITDPVGAGNATATIPGFIQGSMDLGSSGFITLDGGVATWASSSLVLNSAQDALTMRILGACTGTGCASLGTTGNVTVTYVPAPTITDLAGNPAAGSFIKTQTMF